MRMAAAGSLSENPIMTPMTRMRSPCWASAQPGQGVSPPPSSERTSRRLIMCGLAVAVTCDEEPSEPLHAYRGAGRYSSSSATDSAPVDTHFGRKISSRESTRCTAVAAGTNTAANGSPWQASVIMGAGQHTLVLGPEYVVY